MVVATCSLQSPLAQQREKKGSIRTIIASKGSLSQTGDPTTISTYLSLGQTVSGQLLHSSGMPFPHPPCVNPSNRQYALMLCHPEYCLHWLPIGRPGQAVSPGRQFGSAGYRQQRNMKFAWESALLAPVLLLLPVVVTQGGGLFRAARVDIRLLNLRAWFRRKSGGGNVQYVPLLETPTAKDATRGRHGGMRTLPPTSTSHEKTAETPPPILQANTSRMETKIFKPNQVRSVEAANSPLADRRSTASRIFDDDSYADLESAPSCTQQVCS